jgi:hypothetical protein
MHDALAPGSLGVNKRGQFEFRNESESATATQYSFSWPPREAYQVHTPVVAAADSRSFLNVLLLPNKYAESLQKRRIGHLLRLLQSCSKFAEPGLSRLLVPQI